jgi:hypothetical protein
MFDPFRRSSQLAEPAGCAAAGLKVMAVVQTAMLANLPNPRLCDAILAHPTIAEGLGDLFAKVPLRFVGHAGNCSVGCRH